MIHLRRLQQPAARTMLLCTLLAAGYVPAARAADDDDAQTRLVSSRGLDLASLAGQAEMARRIEMAARRVCNSGTMRTLSDRDQYDACRDDAMAQASIQLRTLIARAGGPPFLVAAGK